MDGCLLQSTARQQQFGERRTATTKSRDAVTFWPLRRGPTRKQTHADDNEDKEEESRLYLCLCCLAHRGPGGLDLRGEGFFAASGTTPCVCVCQAFSHNLAVIVKLFLQTLKKIFTLPLTCFPIYSPKPLKRFAFHVFLFEQL